MQRLPSLHPPHEPERHRQLVPREIPTPILVRKDPYISQRLDRQPARLENIDGGLPVEYSSGVAILDEENLRRELLFFLCRSECRG